MTVNVNAFRVPCKEAKWQRHNWDYVKASKCSWIKNASLRKKKKLPVQEERRFEAIHVMSHGNKQHSPHKKPGRVTWRSKIAKPTEEQMFWSVWGHLTHLWTWLWNSRRRRPSWRGEQGKLHHRPLPLAWHHRANPLSSAGQIPAREKWEIKS